MSNTSIRTTSIDACRGLAVIFMVLDHTRDYFSNYAYSPTDLTHPNTIMFFMRFITHFCAPWFVFLAGTGIGLSLINGKPRKSISRFLLTRGLWLIFVELIIIRYGCFLDYIPNEFYMGVMWALGISMVVLSALIYLPVSMIFLIGISGIAFHNLLDITLSQPTEGIAYWFTFFLHHQGKVHIGPVTFDFDYPFIVWTCLAMLGIVFAKLWTLTPAKRIQSLWLLALLTLIGFIFLRGFFAYGDPNPFIKQNSFIDTLLAFLNNEKYPPSLTYLLMTMGPGILFIAAYETFNWKLKALQLFGRVPMFIYMIHFPMINMTALLWFFSMNPMEVIQATMSDIQTMRFDYGFNSLTVALLWMLFIVALYPLCVKYGTFRKNNPQLWWVRYI